MVRRYCQLARPAADLEAATTRIAPPMWEGKRVSVVLMTYAERDRSAT